MRNDPASYSQHGEDLLVARRFGNARGEFFVEVGALDGITYSNTFLLERDYEWRGLLVEANPAQAELCTKNRPGSTVIAEAATSPDQAGKPVRLDVVEGFEALSSTHITPRVAAIIDAHTAETGEPLTVRSCDVPSSSLDSMLSRAEVPMDFAFLSIDIEGHEWPALQGFSLGSRWRPRVVLIESAELLPDRRVVRYMREHGYGFRRRVGGWNHWYEPTSPTRRLVGEVRLYVAVAGDLAKRGVRRLIQALGLLPLYRRARDLRSR